MAAAALLAEKPRPTDADIDAAVLNICRCGTYGRIRRAIHRAAAGGSGGGGVTGAAAGGKSGKGDGAGGAGAGGRP
jgi:isoquinoline 1-oxidoreductase alpha subunit